MIVNSLSWYDAAGPFGISFPGSDRSIYLGRIPGRFSLRLRASGKEPQELHGRKLRAGLDRGVRRPTGDISPFNRRRLYRDNRPGRQEGLCRGRRHSRRLGRNSCWPTGAESSENSTGSASTTRPGSGRTTTPPMPIRRRKARKSLVYLIKGGPRVRYRAY